MGESLQTIAGLLGNVFEWFDFAIFGMFADTIGAVFFPPNPNDNSSLVASYIVFGGAFLARPLGGIISGIIGDRLGRKRALTFSLVMMCIPTTAMGFLPTYQQAGGLSTALLVICRLLQGFSVGGQLPSSMVYTLELKPKEHWGYYGSLIGLATGGGALLGNLVGAIIRQILNEDQLEQYGWRVAFWTGILILPVTIFVHCYGVEHHPNQKEYDTGSNQQESKHPLRESFRLENWAAIVSSVLVPMLGGSGYYITFVWMPIYMESLVSPPIDGAFWVTLVASSCFCVFPIFFGHLSDKVGRRIVINTGSLLTGAIAPVMVWVISLGGTARAFFAQWFVGLVFSIYSGPIFAFMPEIFPAKVRLTSAAFGYNVGVCLSAGFAPAIATALYQNHGPWAAGAIYPFFAVLSMIGVYIASFIPKGDEDDDEVKPSSADDETPELLAGSDDLVLT